MESTIKDIFETAKERIKSPLIGTFVISFLILNWKAVMFLIFSTHCMEYKLGRGLEDYFSPWSFFFAFLFTAAYIFCLPYSNLWINRMLEHSEEKKREALSKRTLEDLKIQKSHAKIQKEIADIKSGGETVGQLQATIDQLKGENTALNTQTIKVSELHEKSVSESNKRISELQNKLKDSEARRTKFEFERNQFEKWELLLSKVITRPDYEFSSDLLNLLSRSEKKLLLREFGSQSHHIDISKWDNLFLNRLLTLGIIAEPSGTLAEKRTRGFRFIEEIKKDDLDQLGRQINN